MYKIISKNNTAEIVEKKSKFIANIFYVESVEEAEEKIKEMKKKYYDARHNCFAYSILTPDGIINRFSDDGEPSGTAGSPMLNIINSKEITNIVVIVTRYFGGILLGTGGLVRAYTGALQEGLKNIEEIFIERGLEVLLEVGYQDLEKLKYYLKQNDIEVTRNSYNENVEICIDIEKEKYEKLISLKNELNFNLVNIKIIREKNIKLKNNK